MADSKPYASLSSGLLARKGGAKPAMRPQGFNNFGGNFDDLGWNDMGHVEEELPHHVPSPVGLTPAPRSHLHAAPPPQQQRHEDESYEDERYEGAAHEEASHEEASHEEASHEEASHEEVSHQAALHEDAAHEDAAHEDVSHEEASHEDAFHDEEAFDESSFEEASEAPEPAPPPVVAQQRALRESFAPKKPAEKPADADVVALPRRRAAPSSVKAKAAFTLRLDPERHLKLRLASAVTRLSAQQLVTGALDDFLDSLPELEALAERVPAEAGQRRS
jgi:hypothetical protein